MTIKVKAQERKLMVGPKAGKYVYQMTAEKYSSLTESKMIEEASLRSGIQRGALQAAFTACGDVIKAWATEGHSVPVPGLGTMRFGLNARSVEDVNMVASSLITTRKIIFVPSTEVKKELMNTAVNITCYDRNGKVVKRVNSSDSGDIEDPENPSGSDENAGGGGGFFPWKSRVMVPSGARTTRIRSRLGFISRQPRHWRRGIFFGTVTPPWLDRLG